MEEEVGNEGIFFFFFLLLSGGGEAVRDENGELRLLLCW